MGGGYAVIETERLFKYTANETQLEVIPSDDIRDPSVGRRYFRNIIIIFILAEKKDEREKSL